MFRKEKECDKHDTVYTKEYYLLYMDSAEN